MSPKFWRVLWLMLFLLVTTVGGADLSQAQPEPPMGRNGFPEGARPSGTAPLQADAIQVEDNAAEPRAPQSPNAYWMFENFEGNWPGEYAVTNWNVSDNSPNDGGEFLFGKRNCRPFGGSFAGWSVGGGADGSQLGCNGNYPNGLFTWAFYGPETLTGASAARLNFYITGNSEWEADCLYDGLWVGVSTDGFFDDELGQSICEDYSSGYWHWQFNLNDYIGQTIWLGFLMYSDSSNRATGYIIDNVSLDDCRIPGAATLLAPGNGSSTADNTPTFNWTNPTAATEYRLLVDNNSDFSSPIFNQFVGPPPHTLGTALSTGTYYWTIRAYNTAGGCDAFGAWSTTSSFTITSGPTCYPLTLEKSGQGSVPSASPANSSGCASGRYTTGQSITLTASPANGWRVGSWQGTNNNGSTANSNSLTMPAAAHTARVNYVQQSGSQSRAVMPFVIHGLTGFLGPMEVEPNNTLGEANGPILLNRNYQGFPNDLSDYFHFTLTTQRQLTINLTGITGTDPQLHLYRDTSGNRVGYDPTPPYSISYTAPPGDYWVRVVVVDDYNSSSLYTLRVNAP